MKRDFAMIACVTVILAIVFGSGFLAGFYIERAVTNYDLQQLYDQAERAGCLPQTQEGH